MKIKYIMCAIVFLEIVSKAQPTIPIIGPSPQYKTHFTISSPLDRFEAKLNELREYFRSKKACLENRTCSKEAIKNLTTMAAMISVLALYAFVGVKSAKALREETPTAIKLVTAPVPGIEEVTKVPSALLLEKEHIAVQEAPVTPSPHAKEFFDAVKEMASSALMYVDFIIPGLEKKYGLDVKDVNIDRYSLIGAVLQSEKLSVDNKVEFIEWLRRNSVTPTVRDKELAEKSANKNLSNAVA